MSGKEPDFLLKLGIKYENLITDICKLKEENVPAILAPSLQTRREIASFAKSSRTKDLPLSNLWKKISGITCIKERLDPSLMSLAIYEPQNMAL